MNEPHWRQQGEDPDYRFSLANERTFLAWIRTALALLASAVLLEQFADRVGPRSLSLGLALSLCGLGAVLAIQAYVHWRANEIAMRHKASLPVSALLAILATGILCAAAALAVLLVLPGR